MLFRSDVIDILHKSYYKLISVDDFIHKTILKHFYEYMIVGGMPKVVSTFLSSNDFNDTDKSANNWDISVSVWYYNHRKN